MTDENVYLVEASGTSTSLLQRAVAHQGEAWTRLVKLYSPTVYYWCRQWQLQPRDAENLAQEVFLKVWRSLDRFQRDKPGASFRKWLYRIAHNCMVDFHRQRQGPQAVGGSTVGLLLQEIPEEGGGEDSHLLAEANVILYQQAVALIRVEFSARDWCVFQSYVLEDQPAQEVARQLGVSTNVIYITKARILAKLRQEFAGLVDFE